MKLLLSICLICLISLPYCASQKFYCNNNNRPKNANCFNDDAVYEPICGYYTKNCPFSVCAKYASNACDACSDPNVEYYEKHDCEKEKVLLQCYNARCNPMIDPMAESIFEPVCGYRKECTSGDCSKTFYNLCIACKDSDYPWYQKGVCQDDRIACQNSNYLKSSQGQAVCAYFNAKDGAVDRHTTVTNAKTACRDYGVKFYTQGQCSGPYRDDTVYCLPNKRSSACTRDYNPVCGFYYNQNRELQHKVMSNPCTACADTSIVYHQPGPCVFKCDRTPGAVYQCDGTRVDPVCGSYQANGQTKHISLKSSCVGCYLAPIKIDSYTDGLCPGDEGVRCENDASGLIIGYIFPVCGVTQEGCTDSSCMQTYAESFVACYQDRVVLFRPGVCPGDEGVSCSPYRRRPSPDDEWTILFSLTYYNVCGYTQKGCTSSSCRRVYGDQYDACENSEVEFFTAGPC